MPGVCHHTSAIHPPQPLCFLPDLSALPVSLRPVPALRRYIWSITSTRGNFTDGRAVADTAQRLSPHSQSLAFQTGLPVSGHVLRAVPPSGHVLRAVPPSGLPLFPHEAPALEPGSGLPFLRSSETIWVCGTCSGCFTLC